MYGATRADELVNMRVKDVQEQGEVLVVKIPNTKTNVPRSFTLQDDHRLVVRKYILLRPAKCNTDRFFLNFRNGKCTNQVIGRTNFLDGPKRIATFLKLDNPSSYTGHSFRRTSATMLADSGADMLTLKRHGGWRSSKVVEGYISESIGNKRKIGDLITKRIDSVTTSTVVHTQSKIAKTDTSIDVATHGEQSTSNVSVIDSSSCDAAVIRTPISGGSTDSKFTFIFHDCTVKFENK